MTSFDLKIDMDDIKKSDMNMCKALFVSNRLCDSFTGASVVSKLNFDYLKSFFGEANVISYCLQSERKKFLEKAIKVLFTRRLDGMSISAENEIVSLIDKNGVEAVFIDGSLHGFLAQKIKKEKPNIKIFVFYHDICYDWVRSLAACSVISQYRIITHAVSVNEKLSAYYADANIFLSNKDKLRFDDLYQRKKSIVLSVAINDDVANFFAENRGFVLFVGANYKPNIDGIKWYIENISNYCELDLHVVGKNLKEFEDYFEEKNVKLISDASREELKAQYLSSSYVVSPIFSGGGMKVKIAEAMMYGKVILGTPQSFVGYETTKDTHIAKNKKEFICLTKKLNSYKEKDKLCYSKPNRDVFEKFHSISANKRLFKKFISSFFA